MKWRGVFAIGGILLAAGLLAGLRGSFFARLLGGTYPFAHLAVDTAVLAGFFGVLVLTFTLSKIVIGRLLGTQTPARRIAGSVIVMAVFVAVAAPLGLAIMQTHMPRIRGIKTPADLGLTFEPVRLESDGITLDAWYVPAGDDSGAVVITTHGLGANKANFLGNVKTLHELGFSCLILDFRGHGDSGGVQTTLGLKEANDIAAACRWVKQRGDRPLYAWGLSMGGAAVLLAQHQHGYFDRIVVDSTFSSIQSVALDSNFAHLGPLKYPLWQACRFWGWGITGADMDENHAGAVVGEIAAATPLLIVHGSADPIVPSTELDKLAAATAGKAQIWRIDIGGHCATVHQPEYADRLRAFFGE